MVSTRGARRAAKGAGDAPAEAKAVATTGGGKGKKEPFGGIKIGGAVVLSDDGVTPCLGTHDAQGNPIPEHLVGCKFDDDGWLIPPWEVLHPNFDQNTPPEADFISNPRWYERLAMWTFWWSWIFISYQYGLYQGFLYLILWHIICAIFPTICWW